LARKVREAKWTLAKLQLQRPEKLLELGFTESVVPKILGKGRPPIPPDVLIKTLYDNRWVCCVCRDAERPVVVHHIKSWAESRDHSPANLAVLCSVHHGEAHSTHALELTLTADRIKAMKAAWEHSVSRHDPLAIFKATQLMSCQWWYFNHLRVFEIAEHVGVEITQLTGFQAALRNRVCDDEGYLCSSDGLLYVGQGRSLSLYRYMSNMLKAAMEHARVRNISDELDRGTLGILITPGDLVFVQGLYHFADIPDGSAADMVRGRRSVNKVEITFVFDRNEATSGSARTEWLLGARSLGCLLRANKLERDLKGVLHIEATVLAIRSAHEELKSRMYELGLYQSGLLGQDDEDEELEDAALECGKDSCESDDPLRVGGSHSFR
jgi:hypothetical protein